MKDLSFPFEVFAYTTAYYFKKKIIEVSGKLKFEQSSDERVQSKHTNTENLLKPISAAVLVGMS